MDGVAVFVPDVQDGAGRFKIGFFQLADDAVTMGFCDPIAWRLLALRIVVDMIRHFNDEVISQHGQDP